MINKFKIISICLLLLLFTVVISSSPTFAAEEDSNLMIGVQQLGRYSSGLSAIFEVNENLSAQGIIGAGTWDASILSGRSRYKYRREDFWDNYLFGGAGLIMHRYYETSTRFELGVGLEYNWWKHLKDASDSSVEDLRDFRKLILNFELGYSYHGSENFNRGQGVFIGSGVHYKF